MFQGLVEVIKVTLKLRYHLIVKHCESGPGQSLETPHSDQQHKWFLSPPVLIIPRIVKILNLKSRLLFPW